MTLLRVWLLLAVLGLAVFDVTAKPNIQEATVDVRKWERSSMYMVQPTVFIATWTIKFNQAIALKRREGTEMSWSGTNSVCTGMDTCALTDFRTPPDQKDPFALPVIMEAGLEGISMKIKCGDTTLQTGFFYDSSYYNYYNYYNDYNYNDNYDTLGPCPDDVCADFDPAALDPADPSTWPPTDCWCDNFDDFMSPEGGANRRLLQTATGMPYNNDYLDAWYYYYAGIYDYGGDGTMSGSSMAGLPDLHQLFVIPPVSNALPRFVQQMSNQSLGEQTYKIFDDEDFQANTLVLGSIIGYEFPGPDDDETILVDLSQCEVIFGDDEEEETAGGSRRLLQSEYYSWTPSSMSTTWDVVGLEGETITDTAQILQTPVECSAPALAASSEQFEFVLEKMSFASSEAAFAKGISTLGIIKITDGFAGCEALLQTMVDTEWQQVAVPDSRDCVTPRNSTEWASDPCCNKALQFSQCCAPRDIQVWTLATVDGVKDEALQGVCQGNVRDKVENSVISYVQLINDEGQCSKVRENVSPESIERLLDFWSVCNQALWEGKTKSGADSCEGNNECWSNKCEDDGAGKKCAPPQGFNWEKPFLQCAVENMEPLLLNTFRKNVDAKDGDSIDQVVAALTNKLSEEDCYSGGFAGAAGGMCMMEATEEQCSSNPFANEYRVYVNTSASTEAECLAMGEDYTWSTVQVIDWAACGGKYEYQDNWFDSDTGTGDPTPPWRRAARPQPNANRQGRHLLDHDDPMSWYDSGGGWYEDPWYYTPYGTPTCNVTKPLGCVNTGAQCTTPPPPEYAVEDDAVDGDAEEDPYEGCYFVSDWEFVPYNDTAPDDTGDSAESYNYDYDSYNYDYDSGYWKEMDTGFWDCWNPDTYVPWWYYDDSDNFGPYELNSDCEEVDTYTAQRDMLTLFQQQKGKWVSWDTSLSTRWFPASPVQPKCEVVTPYWWSVNHWDTECDADCQCDEMRDFMSFLNGWDIPEGSSKYLQLGNVYDYRWDWDSADYITEIVAEGNKEYCEMEKVCNWRPWEDSVTEEECLASAQGFCCGNDQGKLCYDVKTQSAACMINNVDGAQCSRRGGKWNEQRWECTLPAKQTADDCWSAEFCPVEYWEGWGYGAGFCEHTDICYTAATTEEECIPDENSEWPQWYVPWDEAMYGSDYDFTWDQEFYPEVAMCVQGWRSGSWGGSAGTFKTEACVAAGNTFWAARSFREGQWDSEDACKVCSTSPWDWNLAQNEAECLGQGGYCSRNCEACESTWDSKAQVCVATSINAEAECTALEFEWVSDMNICVGGRFVGGVCEDRDDASILRCRDLAPDECTPSMLKERPQYNGDHPALLQCRVTDWAMCETEAECESSGECDDWELSAYTWYSWDGEDEAEQEMFVCVIPFDDADAWGYPKSSACDTANQDGYYSSWYEWRLGCVVHGTSAQYCEDLGGRQERRAQTESECNSRAGCFNVDNFFVTSIGEAECNECEQGQYEWTSPYRWTQGTWSGAAIQPLSWKQPAMEPKNFWASSIRIQDLERLVRESLYELVGQAYASEAQCKLRPYFDVLQTVGCGCGEDSSDSFCDDAFDTKISTVAIQTLWTNIPIQYVKAGSSGNLKVPQSTVQASAANADNVEVTLARIDGYNNRKINRRRNFHGAVSCKDFEIIPNGDGEVVGQLIGNGVQISGLGSGTATMCIPRSAAFPTCVAKYPVLDFAAGTSANKPGEPLQVQVTVDSSGQYCAEVTLTSGATTVFPVLRTADLKPFAPFKGPVVRRAMTLDIASKELFTSKKQDAFKKSIADALKGGGAAEVSADNIVIEKICDSSGCVDLLATRRVGHGTGITVTYQVQAAEGIDVNAVTKALDDSAFTNSFQQEMQKNGVPVIATVVAVADDGIGGDGEDLKSSAPGRVGSWMLGLAVLFLTLLSV